MSEATLVKLISPEGKVIHTNLTSEIQRLVELEGFAWFEPFQKPLNLSLECFNTIDTLLSPKPG